MHPVPPFFSSSSVLPHPVTESFFADTYAKKRSWFLGRACATARRRRRHHRHFWFLGRSLPLRLRHRSPEKKPSPFLVSWPLSATAFAPPPSTAPRPKIIRCILSSITSSSSLLFLSSSPSSLLFLSSSPSRYRAHLCRHAGQEAFLVYCRQESSLHDCIRRKRQMGPDSGSVISWWAEAPCCRWLAALFGCPSQSRGSSPRLQPSSSSTRSQVF